MLLMSLPGPDVTDLTTRMPMKSWLHLHTSSDALLVDEIAEPNHRTITQVKSI